jgi:hypothetical protein
MLTISSISSQNVLGEEIEGLSQLAQSTAYVWLFHLDRRGILTPFAGSGKIQPSQDMY